MIGTLICIAVPALTLHKVGLWLATKKATKLLPMNWANNLMWLAVINALIMLVVFLVWHFVWGKKEGSCLAAYGFAEDDGKVRASGILKAFLFAVTVGASMCFASPFSTPPNALVMPAGQYTFMDYIKVGLPLQIIMGIVMILVLPLIFPF